jgi:O-antigen/teichoic acid export membrane protein
LNLFKASLKKNSSLKNIFWNLAGGIIAGVSIILITPLYIKLLGVDGYGILSLWLVFQVMLGLFDFGMGPTIVKEFSKELHDKQYRVDLLKTAEAFNLIISLFIFGLFFFSSNWLGTNWFKSTFFTPNDLSLTIKLISISIALQFPSSIYLNVLTGLQEHKKMNIILIGSNLIRHISGIGILVIKPSLNYFFTVQIIFALIQTVSLKLYIWNLLNDKNLKIPKVNLKILKPIWRFSVGMALTSFAAVALSNIDKVILSKMVTTRELGNYSIAFSATGILQLAIQPFYKTYFPRYSQLITENNVLKTSYEYFRSCQLMATILISISVVGFVFAPDLFKIWIGQFDSSIILIFRILLFSITCSGLMWLPSAFQQANNWTRLHFNMILFALISGIPLVIFATAKFGVIGGTVIWVIHGISELTFGLWLMHQRILIGQLGLWYKKVIIIPLSIALPIALLSNLFASYLQNIWIIFIQIGFTGIIILATIYFLYLRNTQEELVVNTTKI